MDDLISRQKAIDAVNNALISWSHMAEWRDNEIRKAIMEVPSAQQWIPCSERLPDEGKEVICQCRANIITVLKLDADGDWYQDADHCYMSGFVLAWMPLPEPYKGEDNATLN